MGFSIAFNPVYLKDNSSQRKFKKELLMNYIIDFEDETYKKLKNYSDGNKEKLEKLKKFPPFSVAMSVYGKDNSEWFGNALDSIINQTVKPNEIVLVVDGLIPHTIQNIIDKYSEICKSKRILFQVLKLPENKGLGNALRLAVDRCSNEIIARMDSDDVAVLDRFEQQLHVFMDQLEVDIVGGDIQEFIETLDNKAGKRKVPVSDTAIKEYMKSRCPLNHVTVMYKKSAVMKAGGYKELFWNEDYYLWIRMVLKGCCFANTGTVLVNVRVGKNMYMRRGGKRYFKSEKYLQSFMLKYGIINKRRYSLNIAKRFCVQILMPNKIRGWVFRKFARS